MKGKTAGITITQVILLALALFIAFIVVTKGGGILWGAKKSFEGLGPSKCTEFDKTLAISVYEGNVKMYGLRTRADGAKNELYDPELALSDFKVYLACKQENVFNQADATKQAEVQRIDSSIMNTAKSVYVYMAEDICAEYKKAASGTKSEQKDIRQKYSDLADDYEAVFKAGELAKPSGCTI